MNYEDFTSDAVPDPIDEVEVCCRTCLFFRFLKDPGQDHKNAGPCNRFPPSAWEGGAGSRYPLVNAGTWCGEWKYNPRWRET